eukprot:tig00000042_g15469.t1
MQSSHDEDLHEGGHSDFDASGSLPKTPRGLWHANNCRACQAAALAPRRREKITKTQKPVFFSATGRFSGSPVGDGADEMYEDSPIASKYPAIAREVEWDPIRHSCNSVFYSQSPRFSRHAAPGEWVPDHIAPGTYRVEQYRRAITLADPTRPLSSFASCGARFQKPAWEKTVSPSGHDLGYYDPDKEASQWLQKGSAMPRAPRFTSKKFFPDESAEQQGTRRSKERPLDVRDFAPESSLVKATLARTVERSPQRYSSVFRSTVKRFDPPQKKTRGGREVGPATYAGSYYRYLKAW